MKGLLAIFVFVIFYTSPGHGESFWSGQGQVSLELRQFENDEDESTIDSGVAVFSRLKAEYEKGALRLNLSGHSRVDRKDSSRQIITFEDFYGEYSLGKDDDWQVLVGQKIFTWRSMEVFDPADIINSRNLDSDLENLEKKGELTFSLSKSLLKGNITAYFWPLYEDPHFPQGKSRLGLGNDIGEAVFVDDNSNDEGGSQWGIKINQVINDFDLSVFYIRHMDRQFPIVGNKDYQTDLSGILCGSAVCPTDGTINTPYFFRVTEMGGTLTWVWGSLITKFEGVFRNFDEDATILTLGGLRNPVDHQEFALGLEYGITHDKGSESSFFLEGGGIFGTTEDTRYEISAFQRDMFVGYRYSFNDVDGKEILLGLIFDLERSEEYFYNFRYSQRLNNNWRFKIGARLYDAEQKGPSPYGLEALDGDSQTHLSLDRYF